MPAEGRPWPSDDDDDDDADDDAGNGDDDDKRMESSVMWGWQPPISGNHHDQHIFSFANMARMIKKMNIMMMEMIIMILEDIITTTYIVCQHGNDDYMNINVIIILQT